MLVYTIYITGIAGLRGTINKNGGNHGVFTFTTKVISFKPQPLANPLLFNPSYVTVGSIFVISLLDVTRDNVDSGDTVL